MMKVSKISGEGKIKEEKKLGHCTFTKQIVGFQYRTLKQNINTTY